MNDSLLEKDDLNRVIQKADILLEALPHIQRLRGETFVIKYGGHAMLDPELKHQVMMDLVLMENIGVNPVVVHGGGPEISTLMDRMGIEARFIDGQRVTDQDTLEITEMVLAGKLNGEIVSTLNKLGGRAVGLSGKDGNLIIARKLEHGSGEKLGYVGEVESMNPEVVQLLDQNHYIPVISPIGISSGGQTYNINADTVAAELAVALGAHKLILLTDVRGICRDPADETSLIQQIQIREVEGLIGQNLISGGMIPKVRACVNALSRGVTYAHILDGRMPHVLLLELFTDHGVGTMIRKDDVDMHPIQ
jgi:acetylglutamate kinase